MPRESDCQKAPKEASQQKIHAEPTVSFPVNHFQHARAITDHQTLRKHANSQAESKMVQKIRRNKKICEQKENGNICIIISQK